MPNPFADPDSTYLALRNSDGEYSLWPARLPAPVGWDVELGPAPRQSCLDHIAGRWTDMRPRERAGLAER